MISKFGRAYLTPIFTRQQTQSEMYSYPALRASIIAICHLNTYYLQIVSNYFMCMHTLVLMLKYANKLYYLSILDMVSSLNLLPYKPIIW